MGPLLKGSGMASQDIAALGMAFKASGAEVEVAGTAMKNFTNVLALGNSMTKDQKEIFSRLGLDPKAMQKQMQTDAKGAIMTLLKQIKRVPVERQNEVAMKLFGQESIARHRAVAGKPWFAQAKPLKSPTRTSMIRFWKSTRTG